MFDCKKKSLLYICTIVWRIGSDKKIKNDKSSI